MLAAADSLTRSSFCEHASGRRFRKGGGVLKSGGFDVLSEGCKDRLQHPERIAFFVLTPPKLRPSFTAQPPERAPISSETFIALRSNASPRLTGAQAH